MYKIYGYIKKNGFAIGENNEKFLMMECTPCGVIDIIKRGGFIRAWNSSHLEKIYKISIEWEE